jgi:hypothetical protein
VASGDLKGVTGCLKGLHVASGGRRWPRGVRSSLGSLQIASRAAGGLVRSRVAMGGRSWPLAPGGRR